MAPGTAVLARRFLQRMEVGICANFRVERRSEAEPENMNYRHAFHAGNHTEVFKHSILVMLLEHFLLKDKPFFLLDTHAGLGLYDLSSDAALRTNEKADGIERIYDRGVAACPRYTKIVHDVNGHELRYYPGSPEIAVRMLRPTDRLVACELHPEDHTLLKNRYGIYKNVLVQHRNGYEAVKALLPPPERRGLVFIDPPFEVRSEAEQMLSALSAGLKRWATGTFCLWYPIKGPEISRQIATSIIEANYPKALQVELLPYKQDGEQLAGSGIVICNTPWKLDDQARSLCRELATVLGEGRGKWHVTWLTKDNSDL